MADRKQHLPMKQRFSILFSQYPPKQSVEDDEATIQDITNALKWAFHDKRLDLVCAQLAALERNHIRPNHVFFCQLVSGFISHERAEEICQSIAMMKWYGVDVLATFQSILLLRCRIRKYFDQRDLDIIKISCPPLAFLLKRYLQTSEIQKITATHLKSLLCTKKNWRKKRNRNYKSVAEAKRIYTSMLGSIVKPNRFICFNMIKGLVEQVNDSDLDFAESILFRDMPALKLQRNTHHFVSLLRGYMNLQRYDDMLLLHSLMVKEGHVKRKVVEAIMGKGFRNQFRKVFGDRKEMLRVQKKMSEHGLSEKRIGQIVAYIHQEKRNRGHKTKTCRDWMQRKCKYDEKQCKFLHGVAARK